MGKTVPVEGSRRTKLLDRNATSMQRTNDDQLLHTDILDGYLHTESMDEEILAYFKIRKQHVIGRLLVMDRHV